MGISGLLDGFSDFQRNLRFGPKLAKRVAELRKKADLLRVLFFFGCDEPFQRKDCIVNLEGSYLFKLRSGYQWLVRWVH